MADRPDTPRIEVAPDACDVDILNFELVTRSGRMRFGRRRGLRRDEVNGAAKNDLAACASVLHPCLGQLIESIRLPMGPFRMTDRVRWATSAAIVILVALAVVVVFQCIRTRSGGSAAERTQESKIVEAMRWSQTARVYPEKRTIEFLETLSKMHPEAARVGIAKAVVWAAAAPTKDQPVRRDQSAAVTFLRRFQPHEIEAAISSPPPGVGTTAELLSDYWLAVRHLVEE